VKHLIRRRPAGTPTGGQFAPTNRPGANGLGLVDDEPVPDEAACCEVDAEPERDRVYHGEVGVTELTPDGLVVMTPALQAMWDAAVLEADARARAEAAEAAEAAEDGTVADRAAAVRSESRVARGEPRNWRSIELVTPSEPIIVFDEIVPRSEFLAGVIDIESVIDDHSRDPEESASWGDEEWLAHLRRLIDISCETGSAEITPDGEFRVRCGLPRLEAGTVRYVNPDGSPGGAVSTTALVGDDVWISVQASVLDDACVLDSARIEDQAVVCQDAIVCDEASVGGRATILGRAVVLDRARVQGDAFVEDDAIVAGYGRVGDSARIAEHGIVCAHALVCDHALVAGFSRVSGHGQVADWAQLRGRNLVTDNAIVSGRTVLDGWLTAAGYDVR